MKIAALAVSVSLAAASTARAHHSAAATYDATRTVAVTGTVVSFAWTNPHSHLYLHVTDGPFKGQEYVIELSSPVVLAGEGWSRAEFKAGDRVTIHVFPSRAGTAIGLCRGCVVRVNGVTKARTVE